MPLTTEKQTEGKHLPLGSVWAQCNPFWLLHLVVTHQTFIDLIFPLFQAPRPGKTPSFGAYSHGQLLSLSLGSIGAGRGWQGTEGHQSPCQTSESLLSGFSSSQLGCSGYLLGQLLYHSREGGGEWPVCSLSPEGFTSQEPMMNAFSPPRDQPCLHLSEGGPVLS